jgi:hypothetical protein
MRGVSHLIVALILGWKILTWSFPWTFLKLIKIGFGAIKVAKVNMANVRQLAKETTRQAVRDF